MGRPQQGGTAVRCTVRRLEICPALASDIRAGFRPVQGQRRRARNRNQYVCSNRKLDIILLLRRF